MKKQCFKEQIITEICNEKGIEKKDISYEWITILKKGDIQKKIVNYKIDANSSISEKIANDKYSTYEVLKNYNIPIVEHTVLFNENIMPEYVFVNDDYNVLKNNDKVVIKVNESSQGKDVFLCDYSKQKLKIVKELFAKGEKSVSVCPYKEIIYEYRAFYVYGKIEYIYKKQKPFVIGDGISTIKELIDKNLKYLKSPLKNIDLNYIPKLEEKIIVGWKHNLSEGAIPIVIDKFDNDYKKIEDIALKTAKAIGLNMAAIDIIITKNKEMFVLEVNPNFGISKFCEIIPEGYGKMKKLYSKVLDKIFEKE